MPTTRTHATTLDAVKARQRRTWASGDYAAVATRITLMAERLVDVADPPAGAAVFDVATGSGNAALAAARAGATVTGVDFVPELLEQARARAVVEGLHITFIEGDAERLPVGDGAFDVVLSCVGVMFTPDHERAAAELVRVCRPGGTIALANWTPNGFIGGLLAVVSGHVPPPPGLRPPTLWGTEPHLRALFGDRVTGLAVTEREFVFRYRSPEAFIDFFESNYGPLLQAFAALDEPGRERLRDDLVELIGAHARPSGPSIAIPSTYVEVTAVRR